jgi:hypothetical protein
MSPAPASAVEEVVGKLTEAQRKAVLTDDRHFAIGHRGKWFCTSMATAKRLFSLGLIVTRDTLSRPTPLGLEVRALLLKENPHA